MKLALREDTSRGGKLAEQLAWLEGLGFNGIECRISGPYDEALAETATLLRELWDAA